MPTSRSSEDTAKMIVMMPSMSRMMIVKFSSVLALYPRPAVAAETAGTSRSTATVVKTAALAADTRMQWSRQTSEGW